MAAEELDLTIIEATAEYRPGHQNGTRNHQNGTRLVESHGAETPLEETRLEDEIVTPPAADIERSSLESRIAQLEDDLESWRRRAVTWRERALSVQALNEALSTNLDDLRLAVRAMAAGAPPTPEVEEGVEEGAVSVPANQYPVRQPPSVTVVEWCNKVFRRDFWTGPR